MKTSLKAGILAITLCGQAAAEDRLSWTFAACAGRFSAELEHSRLMGGAEDVDYQGSRQAFVALAEAASSPEAGRKLLSRRIDAKIAQARLLQAATFQDDERRANYAKQTAAAYIRSCRNLLLGG